ncbi:efflux RND transporter permease subunit [Saccharospirillum salsuginis]|uniref:Acriflavin resistance protein n=1 Tax=Saccharospirillum salsuginis TaxID=418750 RepID=A0A918K4Q4_9GAMM|nr:efflux RND transporter permease subunit [Saccharospirillum salsuginis]GGX47904.1 acriflavin resistance protein [Saccharospirillum salsuginis]
MMSILAAFARHRIAPNALMFIVIFLGLIALDRLNTQFLPDFELKIATVNTDWPGASAEDVQQGVTIPLEQSILQLTEVDRLTSTTIEGAAFMTITFKESVDDVDQAISDVEKAIEPVNLPEGADEPSVQQQTFYEPVAEVLLYGDQSLDELQVWAETAEKSLKAAGIAKVDLNGLPERSLEARLNLVDYLSTDQSLSALGQQLAGQNVNRPAGITGDQSYQSQIRVRNEAQQADSLARQSLTLDDQVMRLDQLARVSQSRADDETRVHYQGLPAVRLALSRTQGEDTLAMAEVLNDWVADFEPTLPSGMQLHIYNQNYEFVQSRVNIILSNGLGGMLLVLIVLFIFLNHRLAWWVAAGVPISFLATFVFLELTGNSINLISLFGFLVALGVIVDDAIVVGENAYARMEAGDDPQTAAIGAARRMLPAVLASSITTIAAFLPLLLVGGQAGVFTKSVPLVVIMAIAASLIECFLILPGHLAHSFAKGQKRRSSRLRQWFDGGFDRFRQGPFRRAVTLAMDNRGTTFALVVVALVLAGSLVASGRVKFVFFPAIQQPAVQMNAEFAEGTDPARVRDFLDRMEAALFEVEANSGLDIVETTVLETHKDALENGGLYVQLDDSTERPLSNAEIIRLWRAKVAEPAGLVDLEFVEGQQGPSTDGVSVRLVSEDLGRLQTAAGWLKNRLAEIGGLIEIRDNLPLGAEQLDLQLTPDAKALGLTPDQLARTLSQWVDGYPVQSLQVDGDEIDVTLALDPAQVDNWFSLSQIPLPLPDGRTRPLGALAQPTAERAIQQLNRVDGELSVLVSAKLNDPNLNLTEVNRLIDTEIRSELRERYPNLRLDVEGDQQAQSDFFRDVQIGAVLGLLLIFIALAWVFESWSWPLAVMSAIPFGLTGAIAGHWIMGLELSVLSIYGLFGLSGIVINDSIVLVTFYRQLREQGMAMKPAVIEASVQRLRAVLLTTLTTVGGLSFLLFETSFDAQFLIPMAAGLAFGLIFATVLILFYVPAMLITIEGLRLRARHFKDWLFGREVML